MHAASRQIWRPLRSFLIFTCAGGVVLAADNTWRNEVRFDFATTDWWSSISSVEMQTADIAVASEPANHRAPELSMGRLLHGLLFSKPSTNSSWRLAPEKAEYTSAWMTQQSGGTFSAAQTDYYVQPSFFSTDTVPQTASLTPTVPAAVTSTDGVWAFGNSGNWGTSSNWSAGVIADGAGATADFSQLNIANNVNVFLDSSRTIKSLYIGDTDGTNTYNITPISGSTITFDKNDPDFFVNSILQQSSTSAGDTINANIFVKNDLEINNLSATHAFTITGNIASSGADGSFHLLWINNHDTTSNAAGDINISGNISNGSTGGRLGLAVINGGTITLSGTNSYTGSTEVDGGILLINGDNSAANGGIFVYNGGTLGGTGTSGGNLNLFGGSVTGGTTTTVGTLTLLGNVNFQSGESGDGGTYVANLLGGTSDLLAISGSITLGLDTTLDIVGTGDGVHTYILATFGSRFNNTEFQFIGGDGIPVGYTLVYNPTDIELVPTAIPEPATWIGGALALGAIGFAWRSRKAETLKS